MSRKKQPEILDLKTAVLISPQHIKLLRCPEGKQQAFLSDTTAPRLKVRVTKAGSKAFIFEGKLRGKTIRRTIGDPRAWSLKDARSEANRLSVMLDQGKDPRDDDKLQAAEVLTKKSNAIARELKVGEVWSRYIAEGKPKKKAEFKPRYLEDIKLMASPGGLPKKRGIGVTRVGPIFPLLSIPLSDITDDLLKEWNDGEATAGRDQATRALMIFRGFLRWSSEQPEYRHLVDLSAGKSQAILNNIPSTRGKSRRDSIGAAQLSGWWRSLEKHGEAVSRDYLRALVLTGARREEMAGLTWNHVDFKWNRLTLADKVGKYRSFPMSGYLASLLKRQQPKQNAFVFFGEGEGGHIVNPSFCMTKALEGAEIGHVTIHGLRRTFSRLAEAAGAPAGAVDQIMGHAAKDVSEDYRWRDFDTLAPVMDKVERYILKVAKIKFTRSRGKSVTT